MYTLSGLSYKPRTIDIVPKECLNPTGCIGTIRELQCRCDETYYQLCTIYDMYISYYAIIRRPTIYIAYHIFN